MTNIEWTDRTWNPVRGCSKVSPGCTNCYAERTAARQVHGAYSGLVTIGNGSPRWTGVVELINDKLAEPLSWRKAQRVFVNSMSDLFHEQLTAEEIAAVFASMALAPSVTFQVLTKRADCMRAWFTWAASTWPDIDSYSASIGNPPDANVVLVHARNERVTKHLERTGEDFPAEWPLPNVWLGVSVENQAAADERIPLLLETPAAVRFLSVEPLLGPVNLAKFMGCDPRRPNGIGWVIVGGESGPGARPCNRDWIRSVVRQCESAGVPVFVKQLGARCVGDDGRDFRQHDRKGGDPDEWPADLRVRQFPRGAT